MSAPELDSMVSDLVQRGVQKVHVLAWRDLDDPDAGGSEVHADEFMTRWASAGLTITHRTSAAVDRPEISERHDTAWSDRGGRMTVFPRTMIGEMLRSMGPYDAVVEIWNGVPWLSPIWCRKPRVLVLHHIHGPMWNQMFPAPLAAVGRTLETRWAPPFYRSTPTVTTSDDTRTELLDLGWKPDRVITGPVGVDDFFCTDPAVHKTDHPSVLAVGRQAPVKRFELLLEQVERARENVAGLRLTLVGDGPERASLEKWVRDHQASEWVEFAGRVSREHLRDLYRRSWTVASASLAEGWGLALTEAAGCGTPAVATDISGHRCSVLDGTTGLLAPVESLGRELERVLVDHELRHRLSLAAEARARTLTWDALATDLMRPLHSQVVARKRQSGRS